METQTKNFTVLAFEYIVNIRLPTDLLVIAKQSLVETVFFCCIDIDFAAFVIY